MDRVTIRYCSICMYGPRAARVADLLRRELDVEVEVDVERGGIGEFTVLVEDHVVSRRTTIVLQKDEQILESVRAHLERSAVRDNL